MEVVQLIGGIECPKSFRLIETLQDLAFEYDCKLNITSSKRLFRQTIDWIFEGSLHNINLIKKDLELFKDLMKD